PEAEWVFINKPISVHLNKVCMKNKLTHLCVNNMIRDKISADRQGLFDTVFNQSRWASAATDQTCRKPAVAPVRFARSGR
ncbi:hypothetical protein ACKC5Q_23350, partial [Aeromonas dhakensis]|uniref:hypothetical protein n=1 Tax=Aeromonas dhakensis TaxID=196024 RepID=UPI0038B6AF78